MKTVNVFLGADMRLGHEGLIEYAASRKIKVESLKPGEAIVFINAKRDRMKSFSWNKVVSFVRSADINRPIDLETMDYLAQAFSPDGVMDYNKALRMKLEKKLIGHKLEPETLTSKAILNK